MFQIKLTSFEAHSQKILMTCRPNNPIISFVAKNIKSYKIHLNYSKALNEVACLVETIISEFSEINEIYTALLCFWFH